MGPGVEGRVAGMKRREGRRGGDGSRGESKTGLEYGGWAPVFY